MVFPDGDDSRVIKAVSMLIEDKLIDEAILIGDKDEILSNDFISKNKGRISVVEIDKIVNSKRYKEKYRNVRNLSLLENLIIDEAMKDPIVIGSLMLCLNEAEGFIGGLNASAAHMIRNGIQTVKADRRAGIITSFNLIQANDKKIGEDGLLLLADPAVNADPSVGVLCKIAEASGKFFRESLKLKPRIAFLSYSTKGSAEGKSVEKMMIATERSKSMSPEILIDGELELDAAIFPDIAMIKAPDSPLQGKSNILIFPNLDAANIGANLIHFFGNAKLLGPIVFGLNKPYNIVSSRADENDIYEIAIITQLQIK